MLEKKGFTLIELLITIFLISVGLIGVISFFNSSLQSQFDAKNEVIAAGLAQEGVELVRNIRDYNVLNGEKWYELFPRIFGFGGGYADCKRIDYRSLDSSFAWSFLYHHKCYGDVAWFDDIYLNKNTGRYFNRFSLEPIPASAIKTDFKRAISIAANGNLDTGGYLEVTCTVSWDNGSKTTVAKDILYSNQF